MNTIPLIGLVAYFVCMLFIVFACFTIMRYFQRKRNRRGQWLMVALAFVLTTAHWIWPWFVFGGN
jgi:hypothetical protein